MSAPSTPEPSAQPAESHPPASTTTPLPWIEAGRALLDAQGRILHLGDELVRWFFREGRSPIGNPFDETFAVRAPEWRTLAPSAWDAARPFHRCRLEAVRDDHTVCYDIELGRHEGGASVRIQSVLPPLDRLAETPWNTFIADERAQRQMFVRLLRAEAQLDNLKHRLPGVIFSQRADFSFQSVSSRIGELTGIPAEQWLSQARSFWTAVHEADAEELHLQCRKALRAPEGITSTFRLRNLQTGRVSHVLEHRQAVVSSSGVVVCYEGFWLDVTREKIAERRLSSSAWKETLATLTMGLAHDFSNILAGILALSESFIAQVDATHPFASGLELIRQNAWQACQLVRRMMALHRSQTGEQNYHDLNETLAELADLVQRVLPRRILIETNPAPLALPLYVDAVELRQVILNLALNAAEAMPQRGKLVFSTRLCEEATPPPHTQGNFPRLPCVCLSARDTGCGIAPRHLPFVFDPFFTTKPINKGSGLGLYNARLFVEKHRGAISVVSEEGTGTEFLLWLPLADFSEAERVQTAAVQQRPSLLLVGEAGLLHDSTAEFLRVHGFYVMQTFQPDRALDILRSGEHQFRGLMILAGPADTPYLGLIARIREEDPKLPLILELVGSEAEQIPTDLLSRVNLLITSDASESDMIRKLRRLFD